jgi:serpin B
MIRKILTCIFFLGATSSFAFSPSKEVNDFVRSQTDFTFSLVKSMDEEQYVFSPYSIYSTLAMVYQGARGKTSKEMQNVLALTLNKKQLPLTFSKMSKQLASSNGDEDSVKFLSANGLWLNQKAFVLSDFRHVIEDDYATHLQTVDFAQSAETTQMINDWVSKQTQGKIPTLLNEGDLDALTQMVLTNATYFKGTWASPFDSENTAAAPFYSDPTHLLTVEMMEQTGSFPYFESEHAQILALPFRQKDTASPRFACVLILPKPEVTLSSVEFGFSTASFQGDLNRLASTSVHIKCPKFTLCYRFPLNQVLQKMGLLLAFSDQADFSGINGMHDLLLSKVIHAAFFDFNESGVTAAAATSVSIGLKSVQEKTPPIEFHADRPFLFAIVDLNSKVPLFLGKLQYPDSIECE